MSARIVWATLGSAVLLLAPGPAAEPAAAPQPAVRISGKALTDQGAPVPGVKITCLIEGGAGRTTRYTSSTAVADANGEFALSGPAAAKVTLAVVAPPPGAEAWLTDIAGLVAPAKGQGSQYYRSGEVGVGADGRGQLTLRFGQPTAKIVGTVRDEDGRGVSGAVVQVSAVASIAAVVKTEAGAAADLIRRLSSQVEGASGADGRYEIGVAPGRYSYPRVTPPAGSLLYFIYPRSTGTRKAWAGGQAELDVTLSLGGALEATVLDAEGQPLAGANVAAGSAYGANAATTNADGRVTCFGLKPEACPVKVSPPKDSPLAPLNLPVTVERGKIAKQEFRLPVGAVLRGRVTTEDGAPAAGVTIGGSVTDATGRFEIKGLPTGPCRLWLRGTNDPLLRLADGQADAEPVVAGGEFTRDVVLHRVIPATLSGKVVGPDGQPVAGVCVTAVGAQSWHDGRPADQQPKPATTDAAGDYRFTGLLPGKCYLDIKIPDDRPLALARTIRNGISSKDNQRPLAVDRATRNETEIKENQENRYDLKLQFETISLVRLRLRDAAGQPVKDVSLRCTDWLVRRDGGRGGSGVQTTASDADGLLVVRLRPFAAGHQPPPGPDDRRELEIKTDPGELLAEPGTIALEARDGQLLEQGVTLRPGATLAGTIADDGGQPVADATVSVSIAEEFDRWGRFGGAIRGASGVWNVANGKDGGYELRNLPAGKFVAVAQLADRDDDRNLCPSQPFRFEVTGTEKLTQDFRLATGGAVEGWTFAADGTKTSAQVGLRQPAAQASVGEVLQNCDGVDQPFRIGRVPPGRYQVVAWGAVKIVPEVFVDVKAGETLRQDVTVVKGAPAANPPPATGPVDVAAEFAQRQQSAASRADGCLPKLGPVTLDGDLAEWRAAAAVPLRYASYIARRDDFHAWNGPADCGAEVLCGWNDQGLCLAGVVADDDVRNDRPAEKSYEQDCLEIYVDGRLGTAFRQPPYTTGAYQLFVRPPVGGQPAALAFNKDYGPAAGARVAGRLVKGGWTFELVVPWRAFPGYVGRAGSELGLQFGLDDYDARDDGLPQPLLMTWQAATLLFKSPEKLVKWTLVDALPRGARAALGMTVGMELPVATYGGTAVKAQVELGRTLAALADAGGYEVKARTGTVVAKGQFAFAKLAPPWQDSSGGAFDWLLGETPDGVYTVEITVADAAGAALGVARRDVMLQRGKQGEVPNLSAVRSALKLARPGIADLAFAAKQQQVFTAGAGGVQRYDGKTGKLLATLTDQECAAVCVTPALVAFAQGNDIRLVAANDGTARGELKGHTKGVRALAAAPDGRRLASAALDGSVRLWDVEQRQELRRLTFKKLPRCVAFAPDGTRLAVGSRDFNVYLVDVATGATTATLSGHSYSPRCLAFAPDGKQLLSGSDDLQAILWDVATGKRLRTLAGHSSLVTGVAFTADGQQAVTGAQDGSVLLWDLALGKELRRLCENQPGFTALVLSGGRVIVGGQGADVLFLSLEP